MKMIQDKLSTKLNQISSTKGVIALFLMAHIVLLLMMTLTFPPINAQIETQAFDLQTFGYSLEDAAMILQNLNQDTKELYIFPQLLLLDILYPFLLALFLSVLMIRLWNLTYLSPKFLSYLFLIPFIAMFFDYFENTLIILMITESVELASGIVSIASMCTLLKGIMTTVSWIVILVLFVIWGKNKFFYIKVSRQY